MKTFRILPILLGLLATSSAPAEMLQGRVLAGGQGPMQGAVISLHEEGVVGAVETALADEQGCFAFNGLKAAEPGRYMIIVAAPEFRPLVWRVASVEGRALLVNLVPASASDRSRVVRTAAVACGAGN
ncbi:MAG: carboxypeptidase regulatory-like domain-containing protein [Acidobacteria bacterium]|nr:carboxypeptidase regulatory-like domain-containing protein [Acidobacteriota bacterium]